jgi:hypothetical protein
VFRKHLDEGPQNCYICDHKTTVVHALKERDPVARIRFCNWFLQSVHDGVVDPQHFSLMRSGFPYVER